MTVAEAVRAASERLAATSDTARLDAELLMAHALGMARSDMLVRAMREAVPSTFEALIERRIAREPVAYILGKQEFYGRDFLVTRDTLIPRGDSETLIEAALGCACPAPRVLDLGTGTGALLITALLEIEGANGIGIDASPAALEVARANAQAHGLIGARARMLLRDWHKQDWRDDLGTFDLILCNPPYVETSAQLDPDVRDHEPASALFAGPEGLDDYRVLVPQLRDLLNDGGVAILEIGAAQGDAVSEVAKNCGFSAEIRPDLAKRPRAVIVR
ncbi:release factor glutamine methyltransferase [Qipengyuania nanhaisediminis]